MAVPKWLLEDEETGIEPRILRKGGGTIPTAPTGGGTTTPPPPSSNGSNPGSGGSGNGGNSGGGGAGWGNGGGGGGATTYAGYLAAQNRKEQEAKRKAAKRYTDLADALGLQAKALRVALGKKGFRHELKQKLANVRLSTQQQDTELLNEYGDRVGSLQAAAGDNERAQAGQSFANLSNAGRERANAMSEAAMQGASESDTLRAQGASLRNWNANQSEVNRSFYDTLTSVNSSLTDLTSDVRSARMNNVMQGNSDKEQLWTNYWDQRGESLTQLGNTYGQMAEYVGMANEQIGSKKRKRRLKRLTAQSGDAFMDAAELAGKAWESPGVKPGIRNWAGAGAVEGELAAGGSINATSTDLARPEGATLRKWET